MQTVNQYNLAVVLFTAFGSFTYGVNSSIIASTTGLPSIWSYFNLATSGPRADWSTQMIGGTLVDKGYPDDILNDFDLRTNKTFKGQNENSHSYSNE
jgi:hypothetical protein